MEIKKKHLSIKKEGERNGKSKNSKNNKSKT